MKDYKELEKKYEFLLSKRENEPIVLFGIECSIGWYDIIERVFSLTSRRYFQKIRELEYVKECVEKSHLSLDHNGYPRYNAESIKKCEAEVFEERNKLPVFEQIKSKYASLRIYASNTSDYVNGLIDFAELCSVETCELCGMNGELYKNGWVVVLCECHAKEKFQENYLSKKLS